MGNTTTETNPAAIIAAAVPSERTSRAQPDLRGGHDERQRRGLEERGRGHLATVEKRPVQEGGEAPNEEEGGHEEHRDQEAIADRVELHSRLGMPFDYVPVDQAQDGSGHERPRMTSGPRHWARTTNTSINGTAPRIPDLRGGVLKPEQDA